MTGSTLLLIVAPGTDETQATEQAQAVLAHWHGPVPKLRLTTTTRILAGEAIGRDVAIVWLNPGDLATTDRWELIGQLEDASLPALLMLSATEQPTGSVYQVGVVACDPAATPDTICLLLQSLWSQAAPIGSLKAEIQMLRAHRVGLAEQIEQIDEELRLAAQLQKEFVPGQLPTLGGAHFHVLWRPAGYVSGDIYDVFRLDDEHIGLFIADAVGHGVPAALMTMYIKRSLKTKHIDPRLPGGYRILEPSESLALLNNDMCAQQTGKVRFATAAYGVLNCRTLSMRFARAGHPYPMWLKADGSSESIEPEGGLLGVFPKETFDQVDVQLQPGDRLLLYSDGFEVAFPQASEKAGARQVANEQYLTEFEALRHGDVGEALRDLEQKLDHQAGSLNQRDDLTVICLSLTDDADTALAENPVAIEAAA